MAGKIVIVDYGMGNLHSIASALNYIDYGAEVSADPSTVSAANALILPGVGSFYKAMERLEVNGLADAILEAVRVRGCKILGICLGFQLMAEYGEEEGGRAGLGIIEGSVKRIPDYYGVKVPHVGFNQVYCAPQSKLFAGIQQGADFYFVHSYRLEEQARPGFTSLCCYAGNFVAAYEHETVYATQFHPEKSQTNGLRLLANFLKA